MEIHQHLFRWFRNRYKWFQWDNVPAGGALDMEDWRAVIQILVTEHICEVELG